MDFKEVIKAWRIAADDLDLKIQTPIVLMNADDKAAQFELLIEDFGSRQGTIIISTEDMSKCDLLKQNGFFCSALNLESYKTYNRRHFIDTLNDWGYFGETSKKPAWYTGIEWT